MVVSKKRLIQNEYLYSWKNESQWGNFLFSEEHPSELMTPSSSYPQVTVGTSTTQYGSYSHNNISNWLPRQPVRFLNAFTKTI